MCVCVCGHGVGENRKINTMYESRKIARVYKFEIYI